MKKSLISKVVLLLLLAFFIAPTMVTARNAKHYNYRHFKKYKQKFRLYKKKCKKYKTKRNRYRETARKRKKEALRWKKAADYYKRIGKRKYYNKFIANYKKYKKQYENLKKNYRKWHKIYYKTKKMKEKYRKLAKGSRYGSNKWTQWKKFLFLNKYGVEVIWHSKNEYRLGKEDRPGGPDYGDNDLIQASANSYSYFPNYRTLNINRIYASVRLTDLANTKNKSSDSVVAHNANDLKIEGAITDTLRLHGHIDSSSPGNKFIANKNQKWLIESRHRFSKKGYPTHDTRLKRIIKPFK